MLKHPDKILVIRFSSIGDIVLTTPVVRCLKKQTRAEIHFLIKKAYFPLVEHNPYIDKIFTIEKDVSEILPELKVQGYDYILDLHKNFRSLQVRWALKKPAFSFDKMNFKKWLLVNFKINRLPNVSIVDRYMLAAAHFGMQNDGLGLDYFLPEELKTSGANQYPDGLVAKLQTSNFKLQTSNSKLQTSNSKLQTPNFKLQTSNSKLQTPNSKLQTSNSKLQTSNSKLQTSNFKLQTPNYTVFSIGAAHQTKRLPEEKILRICREINQAVVLIGGKQEYEQGERMVRQSVGNIHNCCGQLSLHESAAIIQSAACVITFDTGMMHIAAAFQKDILSIWGNTVPVFGMYPYYKNGVERNTSFEAKGVSCRPCSKIGYHKCPKGHFRCMNEIVVDDIVSKVNNLLSNQA